MATLERQRPSSITILTPPPTSRSRSPASPQLSSGHSVPSSPSPLVRTANNILLPSVPTHEPEDGVAPHSPRGIFQSLAQDDLRDPTAQDDQEAQEDDLEELEELKDDDDEPEEVVVNDSSSVRGADTDLSRSMAIVETSALRALSSLLTTLSLPSSAVDQIVVVIGQVSAQNPSVRSLSRSDTEQIASYMESTPDRTQELEYVRTAVEALSPSVLSSKALEDYQLARVLSTLTIAIERLRSTAPASFLANTVRRDVSPQRSIEPLMSSPSRMGSPSMAQPTPSNSAEELRKIFADTAAEPDNFVNLQRVMGSLQSRLAVQRSPLLRSGSLPPSPDEVGPRMVSSHQTMTPAAVLSAPEPVFDDPASLSSRVVDLLGAARELLAQKRSTSAGVSRPLSPPLARVMRSPNASTSSLGSISSMVNPEHTTLGGADLSTNVLSRSSSRSGSQHASAPPGWTEERPRPSSVTPSIISTHRSPPPPRYSEDEQRSLRCLGGLPGYPNERERWDAREKEKTSSSSMSSFGSQGGLKSILTNPTTTSTSEARSTSSPAPRDLEYEARTPADLSMIESSIERLYTAVPQLTDQRASLRTRSQSVGVEASTSGSAAPRSAQKDINIQDLVLRMARSGRMEDQRAAPPPALASPTRLADEATVSSPTGSRFGFFSRARSTASGSRSPAAAEKGSRRQSADEKRPLSPDAMAAPIDLNNDPLFETMHRAASRRFLDQRADPPSLSRKTGVPMHRQQSTSRLEKLGLPARTGSASGMRSDESLFDTLDSSIMRSRMTGQDAVLRPRASKLASVRNSNHRSTVSVPNILDAASVDDQPLSAPPAATFLMDLDTTYNPPSPASLPSVTSSYTSIPRVSFIAEWQAQLRRLNVLIVAEWCSLQNPQGVITPISPSSAIYKSPFSFTTTPTPTPALDSSATERFGHLTTVPSSPPASASTSFATHHVNPKQIDNLVSPSLLNLYIPSPIANAHPSQHKFVLPTPMLQQSGSSIPMQDHHVLQLSTANPPIMNHSEQSIIPLSASDLARVQPYSYVCAHCCAQIAKPRPAATSVDRSTRYRALPSQHWEELVDAWMCHGDQLLNSSVVRGREGVQAGARIQQGDAWVGDTNLVFNGADIAVGAVKVAMHNKAREINDTFAPYRLSCQICSAPVGVATLYTDLLASADPQVLGAPMRGDLSQCSVRLDKRAIVPIWGKGASSGPSLLPSVVAAELEERSDAHGARRIVIEEEESGQEMLLLWLFLPSYSLSLTPSPGLSSILHACYPAVMESSHGVSLQAAKVMYRLIEPSDSTTPPTISAHTERLCYPTPHVLELRRALLLSNAAYPPSRRVLELPGANGVEKWHVGWLERDSGIRHLPRKN